MYHFNTTLRLVLLVGLSIVHVISAQAQLLVMNFDVDATTTVIGPSPTSVSASAGSVAGGATANGLSARINGTVPKADVNLTFANTAGY